MKKEEEGTGSLRSPGASRRIWMDFEYCGVRVQLTEPELTYRDEGDKVVCRVEYFGRTTPMARSAPNPSSGEGPSPTHPLPGEGRP